MWFSGFLWGNIFFQVLRGILSDSINGNRIFFNLVVNCPHVRVSEIRNPNNVMLHTFHKSLSNGMAWNLVLWWWLQFVIISWIINCIIVFSKIVSYVKPLSSGERIWNNFFVWNTPWSCLQRVYSVWIDFLSLTSLVVSTSLRHFKQKWTGG